MGLSRLNAIRKQRADKALYRRLDADPDLLDYGRQSWVREQSINADLPRFNDMARVLGRGVSELEEHKVHESLNQGLSTEA